VHKHLRRLEEVWIEQPIYFVTVCAKNRRPILARNNIAKILEEEWHSAHKRHGWLVGRYVIMPDHAHFFCTPEHEAKPLSQFVGAWKRWTSRRIHELTVATTDDRGLRTTSPATTSVWQREFFDHVLRSAESYGEKWDYVRDNPLRAGLVLSRDDWPYAGEIKQLEF